MARSPLAQLDDGARPGRGRGEVRTRAPSVHPPRDPAATQPPHRHTPRIRQGMLPARLSPLAGRSEVRLQRRPMHPACSPIASCWAGSGPAAAWPAWLCPWCTCEEAGGQRRSKRHRSKRAAAAAAAAALDRRCWAGTRRPPQPLLDTRARSGRGAVALGRRAGLGSSGGLRGLPRASRLGCPTSLDESGALVAARPRHLERRVVGRPAPRLTPGQDVG